jgi:hypothetical protein
MIRQKILAVFDFAIHSVAAQAHCDDEKGGEVQTATATSGISIRLA